MATFTDFNGNTYKGKFKDGQVDGQRIKPDRPEAVSYTHLTLPTICSV